MDNEITIIDFSHPATSIAKLADLPQVIQDAIARATMITSSGFQCLEGHLDGTLIWSAGGHWTHHDTDQDEAPLFTITSIGWKVDGVHLCWSDRTGFASVKKAEALVAGDRIRFNNRDLMTNDGHPTPLQAGVIRIVPVYPGDRLAIFTASGLLTPVAPDKEFQVVEGDFDPTAAPTVYPSEVKVAEVVDGRSIE